MLSSPVNVNSSILRPPFFLLLFAAPFLLTIATFRRIKGATAMRAYSEIHFCFLLSVCFFSHPSAPPAGRGTGSKELNTPAGGLLSACLCASSDDFLLSPPPSCFYHSGNSP